MAFGVSGRASGGAGRAGLSGDLGINRAGGLVTDRRRVHPLLLYWTGLDRAALHGPLTCGDACGLDDFTFLLLPYRAQGFVWTEAWALAKLRGLCSGPIWLI